MTTYALENEAWWVQQWNDLLNSYRFKKRLERGWRYAREGHILSLKFEGSRVNAKVQGTAPEPYQLSIWIDPFTDADWDYVVESLAQKAVYSAKLLAGEMPRNIEDVFTTNGLSLFPFALADVHSKCNCPDPKNPCKHIAAVYYQLGDFFREDPFVLFQLRGQTREQILESLRQKRSRDAKSISEAEAPATQTQQTVKRADLPLDLSQFWQYDEPLDSSLVVIAPSNNPTVLDVLGPMPLNANDASTVRQYLDGVYQNASQQAMMTALSRNE